MTLRLIAGMLGITTTSAINWMSHAKMLPSSMWINFGSCPKQGSKTAFKNDPKQRLHRHKIICTTQKSRVP